MGDAHRKIQLAGMQLNGSRHACAFFHNFNEAYKTLIPFIVDGLQSGDRVVLIIEPRNQDDGRRRLRDAGVAVEAAEERGQLEITSWNSAYLRDGKFDIGRMLELIERTLTSGREKGYALTRLVATMDWVRDDDVAEYDIVAYEARLNEVLAKYDDVVVCIYDLARFGGEVVIDVMRTHSLVIVNGLLQSNPFFVTPQEMLRELEERESHTP
jgi:hypothetical protein